MKTFDELMNEYHTLGEEIKHLKARTMEWLEKASEIVAKQNEIRNHPDYPKP